MDWITTSGSTLHEAKSNALDQLGIVADEAEFDVVNDVEKNFFGRVKTEARVRARVKPKQIPEKDERNSRRRNSGSKSNNRNRSNSNKGRGGSDNSNKGNSSNRQSGGQQNNQTGGGAKSNDAQTNASTDAGSNTGAAASGNANAGTNESSQKSNNNRNRNRGGKRKAAAAGAAGVAGAGAVAASKKEKAVETEISREDQERIAQEFLEGVLGAFDMTGSVAVAEEPADDGAIEIAVTGEELGLLVGQKGITLNSLQELTRTVVQRNADGAKTDRLRVDVAGYRARRTAALQEFATKIANDVLESGSEKLLEPMGPADRKVVHDTINDIEGVDTGSEGEEPRRRVVIRPV